MGVNIHDELQPLYFSKIQKLTFEIQRISNHIIIFIKWMDPAFTTRSVIKIKYKIIDF